MLEVLNELNQLHGIVRETALHGLAVELSHMKVHRGYVGVVQHARTSPDHAERIDTMALWLRRRDNPYASHHSDVNSVRSLMLWRNAHNNGREAADHFIDKPARDALDVQFKRGADLQTIVNYFGMGCLPFIVCGFWTGPFTHLTPRVLRQLTQALQIVFPASRTFFTVVRPSIPRSTSGDRRCARSRTRRLHCRRARTRCSAAAPGRSTS